MPRLTGRKIRGASRGALMIEVLLTISVLSIGLTLIIRSFAASLRASVLTADYSTAILLAENKMYTLMQDAAGTDDLSDSGRFKEPYEGFSYDVDVEDVSIEEGAAYRAVTLAVTWASGQKDHRIAVTTFVPAKENDEEP